MLSTPWLAANALCFFRSKLRGIRPLAIDNSAKRVEFKNRLPEVTIELYEF
ncbi:hypothetical protein [Piscirickettsia salmonis]|uniref:hypothetical protein n=1 Tax=Piscirickettsia salmonis TaxID=1238 RepID=UPI0012BACA3C|nr:hypothetical protein [Piscirickettsia salmonis]